MMSDPDRVARMWESVRRISDPQLREEVAEELRIAERAHEEAMLQDMGEDDCPVCIANRLREAWKP